MNLYALLVIVLLAGVLGGLAIGQWVQRRYMEPRHLAELERMANLLGHGTIRAPQARRINGEPPVELRAFEMIAEAKEVHERKVVNAVAVLKNRYEDRGLTISDEEARLQVERMIAGQPPVAI